MELTLRERYALAAALPSEGNFVALRTAQLLREKVLPSPEEIDEYGIHDVEGGGIRWNPEATAMVFDIKFTNAETAAVIDALRKLDSAEALTLDHVTLYEKFVEG